MFDGSFSVRSVASSPPPQGRQARPRFSVTIVFVSENGKKVIVQRDDAKPAEGAKPYSNEWEITPNPNNPTACFTLRKNGQYYQIGDTMNSWTVLRLSGRRYYHCYEF